MDPAEAAARQRLAGKPIARNMLLISAGFTAIAGLCLWATIEVSESVRALFAVAGLCALALAGLMFHGFRKERRRSAAGPR